MLLSPSITLYSMNYLLPVLLPEIPVYLQSYVILAHLARVSATLVVACTYHVVGNGSIVPVWLITGLF